MEPVVRKKIKGPKWFASLRRTLLKVVVEHLFPARRVDFRSIRDHTIEVKKDRVVPVTVDHTCALRLLHRLLSCYKGLPERQSPKSGPLARQHVFDKGIKSR